LAVIFDRYVQGGFNLHVRAEIRGMRVAGGPILAFGERVVEGWEEPFIEHLARDFEWWCGQLAMWLS
jgi:hypothetical protein